MSVRDAMKTVKIEAGVERPVLDPTGQYVTYLVTETPPLESVETRFPHAQRFETDDILSRKSFRLLGGRLYLHDLSTGHALQVGPKDGVSWGVAFSPRGDRIAFFADRGSGARLWVRDMATGVEREVSDAAVQSEWKGEHDLPTWTRDGSSIFVRVSIPWTGEAQPTVTVRRSGKEANNVGLSTSVVGVERPVAVERIDVATGKREQVLTADGVATVRTYQLSPSQKWIASFTADSWESRKLRLRVTNLSTRRSIDLGETEQTPINVPAGRWYPGGFWSPTEDVLAYQQNDELLIADFRFDDTPKISKPANEFGKLSNGLNRGRYSALDQIYFTVDGQTVVTRLEKPGAHYAVVPIDGRPARQIEIKSQAPISNLIGNFTTLWQKAPGLVRFKGNDPVSGESLLLEASLSDGTVRTVWRGQDRIDIATPLKSGGMIATMSHEDQPEKLYLVDDDLQKKRLINDGTSLEKLPKVRTVWFNTRVPTVNGELIDLKTSILLPDDVKPGAPPPAIVYVYPRSDLSGYANAPLNLYMSIYEKPHFWLSRGYAVVLANLGPVQAFTDKNAYPAYENRELLLPQLQKAALLGHIDLDRLVIAGSSSGGEATLELLTQTNLFRAAVATAPFGMIPGRAIELGDDLAKWVASSPVAHARRIATPLLLIYGETDRVAAALSDSLFSALAGQGKSVELAAYRGEGHGMRTWSRANAEDALQRTLDFVTRYAPFDPPAADASAGTISR